MKALAGLPKPDVRDRDIRELGQLLYLLPAPRHRYVRVGEQQLSRGDILRDSEGLYEIVGIWREIDRIAPHPKAKYQTRPLRVQYRAQCARIPGGERFQQVYPAHHTMLYWVVGGPKLAAANAGTSTVNTFHVLEAAS